MHQLARTQKSNTSLVQQSWTKFIRNSRRTLYLNLAIFNLAIDLAMYTYIYLICPGRLYGKKFLYGRLYGKARFSSRPGKAGSQFVQLGSRLKPDNFKSALSYKHSVPLCWDDIMLSSQIVPSEIVPGEIVPGRNILM